MPNGILLDNTQTKYNGKTFNIVTKGFDINKRGIEPDYEVEYTEKDFLNNKDPQLEKAKSVMEGLLKTKYELAKSNKYNALN